MPFVLSGLLGQGNGIALCGNQEQFYGISAALRGAETEIRPEGFWGKGDAIDGGFVGFFGDIVFSKGIDNEMFTGLDRGREDFIGEREGNHVYGMSSLHRAEYFNFNTKIELVVAFLIYQSHVGTDSSEAYAETETGFKCGEGGVEGGSNRRA